MSGILKPAPSPRRPRRTVPIVAMSHSCIECPACGTETCKTLQDLGMYCDTGWAATEASWASQAGPPRKRKAAIA